MNILSKYKKILLIIGFLIIIILLGYLIYNLFFKPATITPTIPIGSETGVPGELPSSGEGGQQIGTTTGPGEIPGAPEISGPQIPIIPGQETVSPTAKGGVTKTISLNTGPTLEPTLSNNGKDVQYYNKSDGKFYKINSEGEIMPLSDKIFYNVDNVDWAPNGSKAVLEYPDGSNIVYDFNTNRQVTLPKHWEDFNFSPDSNQIISKSMGLDPENRWLIVSNDDGSKARALEFIGENSESVYPNWSPNEQIVAMYTKGTDLNRQELLFIGQNDENFKSTIIEGRGLETQWSKNGDKLLYSVYNNNSDLKPKLWVVDSLADNIGENRKSLEINTWAEKCTFAGNKDLYCAVPDELERGAGMFPETAESTKDSLYKINIETGSKQLVAIPDGDYNISNLVVTENQNELYFTDGATKQIYKINLK